MVGAETKGNAKADVIANAMSKAAQKNAQKNAPPVFQQTAQEKAEQTAERETPRETPRAGTVEQTQQGGTHIDQRTAQGEELPIWDMDESTSINTDPNEHTQQEQSVIEQYKNSADETLADFYEAARNGKTTQRYYMKPLSDRASSDIEEITGKDTRGFSTVFEPRIAVHISNEHGENGRADQSMKDPADVSRMQFILDNYDYAEDGGTTDAYWETKENGRNRRARTVVFSKKVNGTYYVVEAVPITKAKSTYIVSAYMSKTGAPRPTDEQSPVFTAKTENANAPVADNIPSSAENNNNNSDGLSAADRGSLNTAYQNLQEQSSRFYDEGANAARPVDVPMCRRWKWTRWKRNFRKCATPPAIRRYSPVGRKKT